MGDRVRVGEVLAGIGSIGLAFLLAVGGWFKYDSAVLIGTRTPAGTTVGGDFAVSGAVGSTYLGWFALLVTAAAAASGLVFLARVLTSRTSQGPMLQAPVAFAFSLIALITLALRLLLGNPVVTFEGSEFRRVNLENIPIPTDVALGGWLGLLCVLMIVVGTWHAMADERTTSKAARQRTADLLADVQPRPAPQPVPAAVATSDAQAVAEDAVPTDPTDPSTRPSGGPA